MRKIQLAGLLAMTIMTLLVVIMVESSKINCSDPQVWGTSEGVRHCAINGGK